jgi:hypothetical protein
MNTKIQRTSTWSATHSSEQLSKSRHVLALIRRCTAKKLSQMLAVVATIIAVESQGAVAVTHYDAGSMPQVADGAIVTQFDDISGNNNHATGSGGTYLANGIGGLPSVQFTPSLVNDGYISVFAMGSQFGIQGDAGWTQIFVVRLADTSAGSPTARPIFGGLGNGYTVDGMAGLEIENTGPGSARFDVSGGNSNDVILNPPNSFSPFVNDDVIVTIMHQGNTGQSMFSTTSVFINGDAPGNGSLAGYSLGTTGSAAAIARNLANEPISIGTTSRGYVGFNGLLAEVIIYDGVLTETERRQTESTLMQKYRIAGIPEPSTLVLVTLGLSGMLFGYRRGFKATTQ